MVVFDTHEFYVIFQSHLPVFVMWLLLRLLVGDIAVRGRNRLSKLFVLRGRGGCWSFD